jgi:hypothetical protein
VNPVLRVVRGADGGWNLTGRAPVAHSEHHEGSNGWRPPSVVVDTVRVRNARVDYRDRRIPGLGELELRAFNLRLRHRKNWLVFDFNAQALGGPEENLGGALRIPDDPSSEEKATLELHATRLAADQLPDVIGLLWSRLPFGVALSGEVSGQLSGELPARPWPPTQGAFDLTLDGRSATIETAHGWIAKPNGVPLDVQARVRSGGFGLAIDRAAVSSGDVRLEAHAESSDGAGGQGPLRFDVASVDAARLAALLPRFATLHPAGEITVHGEIRPSSDGLETTLGAHATSLALRPADDRVTLADSTLRTTLLEMGGKVHATLAIKGAQIADARIETVGAVVDGQIDTPLAIRVDASNADRAGARIEALHGECIVTHDGIDVHTIGVAGLDGTAALSGRVAVENGGGYGIRVDPEWRRIDVQALAHLLGTKLTAKGRLAGHASLTSSGRTGDDFLRNLSGAVELHMEEGELPQLNLARLTFARLSRVPQLYDGVEKRVRERAPSLLADTSAISALDLVGEIGGQAMDVRTLSLRSPEYTITASGRIAFDGTTDLDGSLVLALSVTQGLVAESSALRLLAEPGKPITIPINVAGVYPRVTSEPAPEFVATAVRRAVGQAAGEKAAGFFKRLLGRGT